MAKFSGVLDEKVTWTRVEAEQLDLSGKRLAVVGGTGGIGRALARLGAARGAEVTVVGRTFRDAGAPRIAFAQADLESMAQARRVARELPAETLDAMVLTTGIMTAPKRQETAEGLERDLAVSYLSRLAILREAAPRLGRARKDTSARPRVFVMGFPGTDQAGDVDDLNSERSYVAMTAHMNTVAGNEALVLHLAGRCTELGVFGLNPGLIKTEIRSNFLGAGSLRHRAVEWLIGLLTPDTDEYARRIVPLLFSPDLETVSGVHFDQKGRAIRRSAVMDEARVRRLIEASEVLLGRALTRAMPTTA